MSTAIQHLSNERTVREESSGAKTETKKVLFTTFDFPPWRTSAVYRMIGLTRALPQFGWQPTVLTVRHMKATHEPQLLEKVDPDLRVERTRYVRVSGWENSAASVVRKTGAFRTGPADARQTRFDRYLRLSGRIVRSILYFPDDTIGWIPFALAKAIQLHSERHFDVVFTTTPPRTTALIGLLVKRLCGLPWVSEFMDPWYPTENALRRKADDRLQSLLMHEADHVVVMVQEHAQDLEKQFQLTHKKLTVVRNGFFEEDFSSLETTDGYSLEPGFIHLAHFGTIYPGNEGMFFDALTNLISRQPLLRNRVRVHIVGAASEEVLQKVQGRGLREITEVHGFVENRADVLRMMRACHCLLLFWGRPDFSRLAVAGKTYEYLRAGRPILAVTSEGGVKQLVEGAEAGWTVPPNDMESIERAILAAIEYGSQSGQAHPRKPDFVAQFRWERQAEILANTLREALGHGS